MANSRSRLREQLPDSDAENRDPDEQSSSHTPRSQRARHPTRKVLESASDAELNAYTTPQKPRLNPARSLIKKPKKTNSKSSKPEPEPRPPITPAPSAPKLLPTMDQGGLFYEDSGDDEDERRLEEVENGRRRGKEKENGKGNEKEKARLGVSDPKRKAQELDEGSQSESQDKKKKKKKRRVMSQEELQAVQDKLAELERQKKQIEQSQIVSSDSESDEYDSDKERDRACERNIAGLEMGLKTATGRELALKQRQIQTLRRYQEERRQEEERKRAGIQETLEDDNVFEDIGIQKAGENHNGNEKDGNQKAGENKNGNEKDGKKNEGETEAPNELLDIVENRGDIMALLDKEVQKATQRAEAAENSETQPQTDQSKTTDPRLKVKPLSEFLKDPHSFEFSMQDLLAEEGISFATLRKRKYSRKNIIDIAEATAPRYRFLENSTRLVFLATLSVEACERLVPKVLADFMNQTTWAWLPEDGMKKVRANCASWKYRTIKRAKAHVHDLIERDKKKHPKGTSVLERLKTHKEIRDYVKNNCYSIHNFLSVFHFIDTYVDIELSKPRVAFWCKHVYLNLIAGTKMCQDNETRSDQYDPYWAMSKLTLYFHEIAKSPALAESKPALKSFYLGDRFLGARRKIEPAEPPFKLDDDDTFGCDEEAPPE